MNKLFNFKLGQLARHGYARGDFVKLNNVYNVIQHNAYPSYMNSGKANEIIVTNRGKTPQERGMLGGMR